jgi:hypothetical protein
LVDFGGALPHQFAANPMGRLQVLLGDGFNGNETHARARYGFADRFGIVGVVFVGFDIGCNELRRNQLDGMAELL